MNTTTPDQILQQAANAAASMLPHLEAERNGLMQQILELDNKIGHMRNLVAAFPAHSTTPKLPETPKPLDGSIALGQQVASAGKAPRGQLEGRIQQILSPTTPMSAKKIKDALFSKFGIDYNRSSIHQNLTRGQKSGAFQCENNQWTLIR